MAASSTLWLSRHLIPSGRRSESRSSCRRIRPIFNLDQIAEYLRSRLANYKIPKRVVVTSELPQLANGKVDRVQLRQQAKDLIEAAPERTTTTPR